jgi:hypothetical protein
MSAAASGLGVPKPRLYACKAKYGGMDRENGCRMQTGVFCVRGWLPTRHYSEASEWALPSVFVNPVLLRWRIGYYLIASASPSGRRAAADQ